LARPGGKKKRWPGPAGKQLSDYKARLVGRPGSAKVGSVVPARGSYHLTRARLVSPPLLATNKSRPGSAIRKARLVSCHGRPGSAPSSVVPARTSSVVPARTSSVVPGRRRPARPSVVERPVIPPTPLFVAVLLLSSRLFKNFPGHHVD
jgi:hypothetical protein